MHCQRNIYQSRTLDLLRNCLSDGQHGGCKQRGQTTTIWLKALLMPRLAVCSRDLHWHWINWTLLCDTIEVSMLRLAWLPIAQHVFQPALTGRLELISRKIVSSEQEQRLSRWADFAKIVSRELNARSYRDFAKNSALLGARSAKFAKSVGKKMGSNMRPRYIQFRDIHDRDISGLHCTSKLGSVQVWPNKIILSSHIHKSTYVCSFRFFQTLTTCSCVERKSCQALSVSTALIYWRNAQKYTELVSTNNRECCPGGHYRGYYRAAVKRSHCISVED